MNYEFKEMNFILMHKEVVFQVVSRSNLPTAMNMLKVNRVVMKQKAQSDEDHDSNSKPIEEVPSTSIQPPPSVANVQQTQKKSRPRVKKGNTFVEMVSVLTQTKKEVVSVNLAADDGGF